MKKKTKEEELYIRRIYPIALSPSSLSLFFCLLSSLSLCFFFRFFFSAFSNTFCDIVERLCALYKREE